MAKLALEGVKVLEFSFIGVTPMSCKILGDNGAEVVRVESSTRLDPLRTSAPYIDGIVSPERSAHVPPIQSDKYGVTLNMKHPKAIGIARRLAAWADIVADGFTTGALERMGLGYEELKKIKPDIIMVSSNTFGQTGPLASFPGAGIQITAFTGFTEITGWPDRGATALGYYTDFVVPNFILAAVLAALDYKRRTGKGQHIDLAHCETGIYFAAPLILDYVANNRLFQRQGNHSPYAAPHGAYRCQGDDRWCAIAVSTDEEWRAFCKVIGNPAWTQDPKFATLLGRKKNEDELDRLVNEWTINHSAEKVMRLMQAAGVAAGVVQTAEDVYNDPQLNHYRYFQWLYYPGLKREFPTELPCVKLSKTPAQVRKPSPMLGEHNEYVYTQMLGMTDEEFVQLMAEGVFE